MPETTAPNLFAAAKAYVVAMRKLEPEFRHGIATSVAMPFYLLAGFAFELSLKAVVLRCTGDQASLRRIGHDLQAAAAEATRSGLQINDDGSFARMISRLSPVHKGLEARYVPDVEELSLPGPGLVLQVIVSLLGRAEEQIDVWCDNGCDPATARLRRRR